LTLVVSLTEAEIADARRLGDEAFDAFKTHRRYYNNLGPSHRKRKLGEVAVEKWAKTLGVEVESTFRDVSLASREDLVVGGVRIEVKTWHQAAWPSKGRSVAPGQVASLRGKSDAIVWCSLEENEVTLHGWSTLDDVEAAPMTATGTEHFPAVTHQVPVEDLRLLDLLLEQAPR
jgi:hypothetical protein